MTCRSARPGLRIAAGVLGALLAVACGAPDDAAPAAEPPPVEPPSRQDEAVRQAREQAMARKALESPAPAAAEPAIGEVPMQVLDDVRGHLAHRIGVTADQIEVVRAVPQTWPDGAMGCAQPGLVYTHQPVEGYWMILRGRGRDYDYRVSRSGTLVLCEGRMLADPPTS